MYKIRQENMTVYGETVRSFPAICLFITIIPDVYALPVLPSSVVLSLILSIFYVRSIDPLVLLVNNLDSRTRVTN